jgi:hypothetical protein
VVIKVWEEIPADFLAEVVELKSKHPKAVLELRLEWRVNGWRTDQRVEHPYSQLVLVIPEHWT